MVTLTASRPLFLLSTTDPQITARPVVQSSELGLFACRARRLCLLADVNPDLRPQASTTADPQPRGARDSAPIARESIRDRLSGRVFEPADHRLTDERSSLRTAR